MKIGILTYHRALNYGAFLQAYALMRYIENLGHTAEIIDYWPQAHAVAYTPFFVQQGQDTFNRVKDIINNILRFKQYTTRMRKMQQLWEKHLHLSPTPLYSKGEDLAHLDYDCIIYGSDQIWWRHSPIATYPGFDPVFWGAYVPSTCRKIAYAASMGRMDIDERDRAFIKQSLERFDAISVREDSLRELLQPLTDKPIRTSVDPTLLVGREFWEKHAVCETPKEKYVLLYSLIPSSKAEQLARQKAKELHCRYLEITGSVKPLKVGHEYIQTADAFEFISYIHNAEYVVTTSFHGTAFSILFEKQFCALGMGNNSSRVQSLLQQLGISERLIEDSANLPQGSIDYEKIQPQLQQIVQPSRQYLAESQEQ